jgi:hypothetical protein
MSHGLVENHRRSGDAASSGDELLTLPETRRSVAMTLLTDPGPSKDQLRRMLTIAARVPDHGALQPGDSSSSMARRGSMRASGLLSSSPRSVNAISVALKIPNWTDIGFIMVGANGTSAKRPARECLPRVKRRKTHRELMFSPNSPMADLRQ